MATGINETTFSANLKNHYQRPYVETMVYKGAPLFALMPKQFDPVMSMGRKYVQPVFFSDPQSRSADIATAITASTSKSPEAVQFEVDVIEDYAVAAIAGKFLRQIKGDKNAFWKTLTDLVNAHLRPTAESAAISMYRSGYGARGQFSSGTTTVTLTNKADIVNFQVGMDVVYSPSEDGAVLRDSGTSALITDVNRNAGTFTQSALPAGVLANDFIFVKGDRENSATPSRQVMSGLQAWLPDSAPSSTAFFGVDRTADSRLYGVSHDGTSKFIDDALIDATIDMMVNGCPPGDDIMCFMNPLQYGTLVKTLRSKDTYDEVTIESQADGRRPITFEGVNLVSPLGKIKVIPDRFCQKNRAWLLKMDTWRLIGLGPIPDILNHGNVDAQWLASDDGIQIRVGYYGQVVCGAPGWNSNVQLPDPL